MQDISAAEVRSGKDIQAIHWESYGLTKEATRQTRLQQYLDFENIPQSSVKSIKECITTKKGGLYYEFRWNARSIIPMFSHLRFRNLVWATSKHDVYLMSDESVIHWSPLTCAKTEILNLSGHVAPVEKHPESISEGFMEPNISTPAVKDKLLVAGGMQGELIVKYLNKPGVSLCSRATDDYDDIMTAIEIYNSDSGAVHFIASNDDSGVRDFDMENFQLSNHFCFPWPVNWYTFCFDIRFCFLCSQHISLSPDGKLLLVVGEDPEGRLVDSRNGMGVSCLRGHVDYSFASAWHPDGQTFAMGNQDKTCRIWDVRNLSKSVTALRSNLGAIRCIRYTSDGRFMAMAEPADYVHTFDVKSAYEVGQEIDFFGEITGMSFSPDTKSLFIGVCCRIFHSFLEFERRHNYSYLDAIT